MLFISDHGIVDDERIKVEIYPEIERTPMDKVNGIVVHQTNGPTASSTFNSYQRKGTNGAHFLIDKNGAIYQTASVCKKTNHIGLLKSRCLITKKCSPTEINKISKLNLHLRHRHEVKKCGPLAFQLIMILSE